jgi:hypothetical protein
MVFQRDRFYFYFILVLMSLPLPAEKMVFQQLRFYFCFNSVLLGWLSLRCRPRVIAIKARPLQYCPNSYISLAYGAHNACDGVWQLSMGGLMDALSHFYRASVFKLVYISRHSAK